ncbi:MAG: MFS transporter [Pseudomonadota bacterium]
MTTSDTILTTEAPSLAPLYIANMVGGAGMMGFVATAGPLAALLELEAWQIGLSATAGGLGWMLSARHWGAAADRIGRKRTLVIGIISFMAAYFLLSLAAQAGAEWGLAPMLALAGLVITRFGMGLGYSAVPAAGGALIADHYPPQARAGAMGRLGAAQASGLLIGPAIVALLAGPSPTMVLFLLAALPAPVLAFVILTLPSDPARGDGPTPPLPLSDKRLIRPMSSAVAAMVAVGTAQIVIGFIALERFGLSSEEALRTAGIALAGVGVALIFAQLVIKRLGWTPGALMRVGGVLSAVGFTAAALAPDPLILIASYAFAGFGAGWVFPSISAAAANAVGEDEQGRAAGAVSVGFGLGAMVGPLLGGALYSLAPATPLFVGAAAMLTISALAIGGGERLKA